ncbi:ribose ABC transport system [Klebsiella pneumoniae subsp. rhinoscleromatis]|nr:ribose ABC transport system [Klebsiella pneumoniae subsp. rhinoscleromatis]
MKLRLTLLTAATLTAFSFAAHAAEKGTIMIMVNSLDKPVLRLGSQRRQRKSASSRLQNHRAVPWRRCQKAE